MESSYGAGHQVEASVTRVSLSRWIIATSAIAAEATARDAAIAAEATARDVAIATHAALSTGIHGIKVVRKTEDQIVNNSAVLVDDDELFFPIGANEVWEFTVKWIQNSSSSAHILSAIVAPEGAAVWLNQVSYDNVSTLVLIHEIWMGSIVCLGLDDDGLEITQGVVKNGDIPGNVQFQFCQGIAEISDTIVRANSCIIAHQLA